MVFALGAGDIFVAIDKWKNARLENPKASVEDIAALAFPSAAGAMFLTTVTTAVAFFATAISPVAPIKMFAVFLGLLVLFDYIMNMLLVFPALVIYDRNVESGSTSCCMIFGSCCRKKKRTDDDDDQDQNETGNDKGDDEKESLIHRILSGYYTFLHKLRWPLLGVSIVALVLCVIFASTLGLPTSSDVRILDEEQHYEQSYQWRKHLLSESLEKISGSRAHFIWGVSPDDTGDLGKFFLSIFWGSAGCKWQHTDGRFC